MGEVIGSDQFKSIQCPPIENLDKIGKLLRNAWLTELQLNLPFEYEFDEFISFLNHWALIQSYYSVYLTLRALFLSMNSSVSHEHSATLKAIGEEIKRRPELFPYPWKIICTGDPKKDLPEIHNLPPGKIISKTSSLSPNADIWSSLGLFLKTTRSRQLKKLCESWKERAKKRKIKNGVRENFLKNLAPTSLFHALYRLRLRSNYEDADTFLPSSHTSEEALRFNKALKKINWCTLFVLETLIARYIKKSEFEKIVKKYDEKIKNEIVADLICKRWEVIKSSF